MGIDRFAFHEGIGMIIKWREVGRMAGWETLLPFPLRSFHVHEQSTLLLRKPKPKPKAEAEAEAEAEAKLTRRPIRHQMMSP